MLAFEVVEKLFHLGIIGGDDAASLLTWGDTGIVIDPESAPHELFKVTVVAVVGQAADDGDSVES